LDLLELKKQSNNDIMQKKFNSEEAEYHQSINSPRDLKKELKASSEELTFISTARKEITGILDGTDNRLLLIVGPCSIHDVHSAKEYAFRLRQLNKIVADSILIVMRTHFEKPRTALGWKGMIYDPFLNESHDIVAGVRQARSLLLELAKMNVPAATEFLDPITPRFIGDLISWGCIGARTVESQIHRQLASGLNMPVGFKNSTSGNIEVAIQGVLFAKSPHTFFGMDEDGRLSIARTAGNPHAHIVLRGGGLKPNYDQISIALALDQLRLAKLPHRLLIDCAHDNSFRRSAEQKNVFQTVLEQYIQGNKSIRGMIIESHLFEGRQNMTDNPTALKYAISLTDPCLDWNSTEQLILSAHALLQQPSMR